MMDEWSIKFPRLDCVDPALGLTSAQERNLRRLASKRFTPGQEACLRLLPFLAFMAGIMLPGLLVSYLLSLIFKSDASEGSGVLGKLVFLALFPIGILAYRYVGCAIWRPLLNRALPVLRLEICPACKYSLRGQSDKSEPCPECGVVPTSIVCPTCGYWLRGLGEDVMNCPECGAAREQMPPQTAENNEPRP